MTAKLRSEIPVRYVDLGRLSLMTKLSRALGGIHFQLIWRRPSYGIVRRAGLFYVAILLLCNAASALAQADQSPTEETVITQYGVPGSSSSSEPGPIGADPSTTNTADICGFGNLGHCLKDIAQDQLGLWSSPARLKAKDVLWLAPFAVATAVAFSTDSNTSQKLGFNPQRINLSNKFSDLGSGYATVGFGAALWSIGTLTHHNHIAETGRLGLEAIADAFLIDETMKLATNRQRPYENLVERGEVWEHGTQGMANSSFPSGHAITTWALARVVAGEYPNKWVQLGAYSVAAVVSIARVTSQNHFPSDVLVGSTLGYLIGGYVVHHHASGTPGRITSIVPVVSPPSRTYGMALEFRP